MKQLQSYSLKALEPYSRIVTRLAGWNRKYLVFVLFAILVVLFYGNTFGNEFVLDDLGVVDKNIYLQSFEHFPKVVTGCLWEYTNRGCKGRTLYYRPVQSLSYLLTHQITSAPWVFHLVNLLYFFAVVSLIFLLAKTLTRNFLFSFIAALVFLIHPMNSEVVNWVSAASDLLLAIFVLLAVIFYVQYRRNGFLKYLLFVLVFYFLAILSKEPGILLPLVFLSIDFLFFSTSVRQFFIFQNLKPYLLFGIPVALYFFMRLSVVGFSLGGSIGGFTLQEKLYSAVTLFATYLWKLLYPYPLSSFHAFQISTSFLAPTFLISLATFLLFFGLIILFIKKQKPLLAFSFVWFLIFLSPVLIFIGAIGDTIFSERYVFVSAIGFAFVVASVISSLWERHAYLFRNTSQIIVWVSLATLIVLGFWFSTFERNKDWKDNETISLKTLNQNPQAHPIRAQLTRWYLEKGELEKTREQSEELIRIAPNWRDITIAYKTLGDYYRAQGDDEAALFYYTRATQTSRSERDYVTYNDTGTLYMDRGEYLKGFAYFCQSLQLLPTESTQNNFDTAVSVIDSEYIQQGILYTEIADQFTRAPELNIRYQDKRCDETSCQYAFAVLTPQLEVIPPFLISAATFEGDEVEITNRAFDPASRVIILDTDTRYENVPLSFIFPTCDGFFYEPVVQL